MVRASLDRQIDTTVIVASCFPLFEQVLRDRQTNWHVVQTHPNTDKHIDRHIRAKGKQWPKYTHAKKQCFIYKDIGFVLKVMAFLCSKKGRKKTNIVIIEKCRCQPSWKMMIMMMIFYADDDDGDDDDSDYLWWPSHKGDLECKTCQPTLTSPCWCFATLHGSSWQVSLEGYRS